MTNNPATLHTMLLAAEREREQARAERDEAKALALGTLTHMGPTSSELVNRAAEISRNFIQNDTAKSIADYLARRCEELGGLLNEAQVDVLAYEIREGRWRND